MSIIFMKNISTGGSSRKVTQSVLLLKQWSAT